MSLPDTETTTMEDPGKPKFRLPESLISLQTKSNSSISVISTPRSTDSLYDKLLESSKKPTQCELLPLENDPTPVQGSLDIPTTELQSSGKKKFYPEDQIPLVLPISNLDVDQGTGEIHNYSPKFILPTNMVGVKVAKYKPPTPAQKLKKMRVSLEGVVNSAVDARHYRGSEAPNGHWDWPYGLMGHKDYSGFIYVIHDKNVNRLYLGKKSYRGRGKLNKGEESNWRWYISSSEELANNVKAMQKVGFDYYCIEEYRGVGALSFAETWSLCMVESPSNKNIWYNVLINKVSWPVREKITERHKQRLQEIVGKVMT